MRVRHFKIINKNGNGYDLLTRKSFLHSPSGLGYKESTLYQRLGEQFAVVDDGFEQGNPKGYIFFPEPNAYEKYFEFVQFCQNTPLYLHYKPHNQEYIMNVRLGEIQKTEIEAGRGLNCAVSFVGQSLWYKKVYEINEGEGTQGKVYTYTYDYVYGDSAINTVAFDSDSFNLSPIKLTIFGGCVNPRWQHYVNNVMVASGGVNGTVAEGMKLVVDTTEIPYSIREYNLADEIVLDMYSLSDFSTKRFLQAKHGRNRISISHSSSDALKVMVEANISYASV